MTYSKNEQKENYIFGLDIGTRTIVGIVGYQTADCFKVVADYVLEHDTRAMIDGQIYDIEKVSESVKKVRHELEKQLGFQLEKVSIAAAGRVLKTTMVHVEQKVNGNTLINDDRVLALELLGIEKAHQEIAENNDVSEGGFHCVGYTVSKYYLNHYEIGKLQGQRAKWIGADILATFLPAEVIDSLYQVVNNAGLDVYNLTLEPIAAINVAIPAQYRLLNIALVDIGAGTSDIAITKEGSIIAYGMIPMAGDEITEALVHEYLIDFKTADALKIKASGKSKTLSYKDIMGLSHTIKREDVNTIIQSVSSNLADKIAKGILDLNNQIPTNAVFLVGGGGQTSGFEKQVADKLKIPKERVALRGKTVLDKAEFLSNRQKTPEMVTPIGICFSALESNTKDYLQVYLNDEPIKIFNTNNITVMDIVAFKGINPQDLIAKKGDDLVFFLNGNKKTIKGDAGEPAKIMINNQQVALNERVNTNDYIVVLQTKKGKPGELSTNQLQAKIESVKIQINGKNYEYKEKLLVNKKPLNMNYEISQNDKVETVKLKLYEILNMHSISYNGQKLYVNGEEATLNYEISNNDIISLEDEKISASKETQENFMQEVVVVVNNQKLVLQNKKTYVIADLFDYIDFDRTQANGFVICEINDEKATYITEITSGDIIKIYWSNENINPDTLFAN